MSYRFDTPLLPSSYHFGNRGLGVRGSDIPASGTNGPGFIYNDLNLPTDSNKEYRGLLITPAIPGEDFFVYEDTSFIYSGPTKTVEYKLYENGTDIGNQTFVLNMQSPSSSINWVEDNDVMSIQLDTEEIITLSLNWLDENDVMSSTIELSVESQLSWIEQDDQMSLSINMEGAPIPGNAFVTGIPSTIDIGLLSGYGFANIEPAGVSSILIVNNPYAYTGISATPVGISSTSNIGSVSYYGNANIDILGVSSYVVIGTPIANNGEGVFVNVNVAGVRSRSDTGVAVARVRNQQSSFKIRYFFRRNRF